MNIFHKVALQGLKKNRTRTFVTMIGVALSAAMITAVATFGVSLLNYMTNGAAQKYGDWHVAFLNVDASFVKKQISEKEVENVAAYKNIGYAALKDGKNPDKPYFFIAGFSGKDFRDLPVKMVSGRLPENSGEILVPMHVAVNGGVNISVGDTITLTIGNRQDGDEILSQHDPYRLGKETLIPESQKTYKVVGICQRPAFEENSAPGYTLITTADDVDTTESFNAFVTLKNPYQVRAYANRVAENYDYILNDDVLRFMGISNDKIFTMCLYAVGGIVIAIIMIGSIFLIYNSFSISLNERTRQIGILSSVGATAKQLRGSVLFEGLCIGAVGIPIGILAGIVGMRIVISVVAEKFGDILYSGVALTLTVSLPVIIGAVAISMVTILISAYIPAKKASGMSVMECIRQTNEVKVEAKAVRTSKRAQRIYGLEGTLALKNFKRNKKQYRSIVLSLILSVLLFITTSSFVIYLKQASEQAVVFTTYDIGFGTLKMEDDEILQLYDQLKSAKGVSESSYQVCMDYSCMVDADDLSDEYWEIAGKDASEKTVGFTMMMQFLDDDAYLKIIRDLGLPAEEYTGQNAKLVGCAKVYFSDNRVHEANEFPDLFRSTDMELSITPGTNLKEGAEQTQKVNMTCAEIVLPDIPPAPTATGTDEQQSYVLQAVAPWSLKERLAPEGSMTALRTKGMTFQSDMPTQTTEEMKRMIEGAGLSTPYLLFNSSEAFVESRNYIFIANVFSYTFIIMISLIAVANVFNTISTNIKLRRRELAMLRSVGMADRDFNKMMRFECAFYGMRALIIGLPLSVVCSWLIYKGMHTGGMDGVEFVMPWASIGISIFSVLLVIFVTMMYAVSEIKKENIIDALRDDMT